MNRYNISGFVEELPQLPDIRYGVGHACAALPKTGVSPAWPTFYICTGIHGCRRIRSIWIQPHFFCCGPLPWSKRLDSPCIPPKNIDGCWSFDCGRQNQGDRGFLQTRRFRFRRGDEFSFKIVKDMLIWLSKLWSLDNHRETQFIIWFQNHCWPGTWVSPWTIKRMVGRWKYYCWQIWPCRPLYWVSAAALLIIRWKF